MELQLPPKSWTVIAEARAWTGNELILNCGDAQPIGMVRLVFNDDNVAHDAYFREPYMYAITVVQIPKGVYDAVPE